MKLRVGYVQCDESATTGLDATLIRVMSCGEVANGGSVQTVYQNGSTEVLNPVDPIYYPKDPIAIDTPPPPPPPLLEDAPAETLQTITPTTTDPVPTEQPAGSGNNTLLIGGGLLLLFFLLGKNKKKKRK